MNFNFVAIDPLALILPTSIYLIFVEKLHPHTPVDSVLNEVLRGATAEEKSFIATRVASLNEYTAAVSAAIKGQAAAARS
jgi:hypothetical protein